MISRPENVCSPPHKRLSWINFCMPNWKIETITDAAWRDHCAEHKGWDASSVRAEETPYLQWMTSEKYHHWACTELWWRWWAHHLRYSPQGKSQAADFAWPEALEGSVAQVALEKGTAPSLESPSQTRQSRIATGHAFTSLVLGRKVIGIKDANLWRKGNWENTPSHLVWATIKREYTGGKCLFFNVQK